MPTIPKSQKRRPWMLERKPFEGYKESPELTVFRNSKRWRGLRKLKATRSSLCEDCEDKGLTVVMKHVDHIKPIKTGAEPWALEWNNLRSRCIPCHNKKTGASGAMVTNSKKKI